MGGISSDSFIYTRENKLCYVDTFTRSIPHNIELYKKQFFLSTRDGYRKCVKILNSGMHSLLSVTTKAGYEIKVTYGSEIITLGKNGKHIWSVAKKLKKGDKVILKNNFSLCMKSAAAVKNFTGGQTDTLEKARELQTILLAYGKASNIAGKIIRVADGKGKLAAKQVWDILPDNLSQPNGYFEDEIATIEPTYSEAYAFSIPSVKELIVNGFILKDGRL